MSKEALSSHFIDEKPQEACGVTAIYSRNQELVSNLIPEMQDKLQHRGQDAAGMAVFNRETQDFVVYKESGLVKDVFHSGFDFSSSRLDSDVAIGHNRYGTDQAGSNRENDNGAQPMVAEWKDRKIALAYNGNIPDIYRDKLRGRLPKELREETFDTLEIARAIVSAEGEDWPDKIRNGLVGVDLAYSITMLTDDKRIFGLRGPSGTWPLWVGENGNKTIFASETRVDQAEGLGEIKWSEVRPGELVETTPDGIMRTQLFDSEALFRCSLHDVYGARPDALMVKAEDGKDDITYGDFRRFVGRMMAQEDPVKADVYTGIPASGKTFAEGYAEEMGASAVTTLRLKTQKRSYIAKTDSEVDTIILQKYEFKDEDKELVRGKVVLATEDSVIKGATSKDTIQMLRDAGAREVHLRTALPKFTNGCEMGYVIQDDKLIAVVRESDGTYRVRSNDEIAQKIGADSFGFASHEGMEKAYELTTGNREIACYKCTGGRSPLLENADIETMIKEVSHKERALVG